jgi:hypothetical protein
MWIEVTERWGGEKILVNMLIVKCISTYVSGCVEIRFDNGDPLDIKESHEEIKEKLRIAGVFKE